MEPSQNTETEEDASSAPEILGREEFVEPSPTKRELNIAKAMEDEEGKFRKLLTKTGLTGERAEFVHNLQQLHGKGFSNSLDVLNGGLTYSGINLLQMIDRIKAKIENLPDPCGPPEIVDMFIAREANLLEAFSRMTEAYIKTHASAMNGALIRAKVEEFKQRQKSQSGNGAPRGKPAFSPQVQKTETHIHVNGQNAKVEIAESSSEVNGPVIEHETSES